MYFRGIFGGAIAPICRPLGYAYVTMYLTAGESTPYKSRSKCSLIKFGGGFQPSREVNVNYNLKYINFLKSFLAFHARSIAFYKISVLEIKNLGMQRDF